MSVPVKKQANSTNANVSCTGYPVSAKSLKRVSKSAASIAPLAHNAPFAIIPVTGNAATQRYALWP